MFDNFLKAVLQKSDVIKILIALIFCESTNSHPYNIVTILISRYLEKKNVVIFILYKPSPCICEVLFMRL